MYTEFYNHITHEHIYIIYTCNSIYVYKYRYALIITYVVDTTSEYVLFAQFQSVASGTAKESCGSCTRSFSHLAQQSIHYGRTEVGRHGQSCNKAIQFSTHEKDPVSKCLFFQSLKTSQNGLLLTRSEFLHGYGLSWTMKRSNLDRVTSDSRNLAADDSCEPAGKRVLKARCSLP